MNSDKGSFNIDNIWGAAMLLKLLVTVLAYIAEFMLGNHCKQSLPDVL